MKCPENVLKSTSRPTSLLSSTYGPSPNPIISNTSAYTQRILKKTYKFVF
jgi:hypothetical protein